MIKLIDICKKYKDNIIYDNTCYEFKENKLTCFYGSSGSGKTTLFNLIAGFDRVFKGDLKVNDLVMNELSDSELSIYRYNYIGFVFQNYHLIKGYSVIENVKMAIELQSDMSEDEKIKRCIEVLTKMKLENELEQKIETLSGGQKQRVAIARAIINDPQIILADEPTGALDWENSVEIMDILKELSKEKTVIIITHDDEVISYADEVISTNNNTIEILNECKNVNPSINKGLKLELKQPKISKSKLKKLSAKNFKINGFKYLLSAIIIAISTSCLIASFSAKDISNKIMDEFEEKNSYYTVGQVVKSDDSETFSDYSAIYDKLISMDQLENIYTQSNIENTSISYEDSSVDISLIIPVALAKQSLAYGKMPSADKNEIALSPAIATGLASDITTLIGKEINFYYNDKNEQQIQVVLIVSAITTDTLKNYILSSGIEKQIYIDQNLQIEDANAISYTIKNFNEISAVQSILDELGMLSFTKSSEIEAFEDTFESLTGLFSLLSYLIFVVGLVISIVTLYRIYSNRSSEIAILSAIGYNNTHIKSILFFEGVLLAIYTLSLSFGFIIILNVLANVALGYGLTINIINISLLISSIVLIIFATVTKISYDLLKKDKSIMLR